LKVRPHLALDEQRDELADASVAEPFEPMSRGRLEVPLGECPPGALSRALLRSPLKRLCAAVVLVVGMGEGEGGHRSDAIKALSRHRRLVDVVIVRMRGLDWQGG
jgi:hypothetical protein